MSQEEDIAQLEGVANGLREDREFTERIITEASERSERLTALSDQIQDISESVAVVAFHLGNEGPSSIATLALALADRLAERAALLSMVNTGESSRVLSDAWHAIAAAQEHASGSGVYLTQAAENLKQHVVMIGAALELINREFGALHMGVRELEEAKAVDIASAIQLINDKIQSLRF